MHKTISTSDYIINELHCPYFFYQVSITGHTGGLSWGTDTYPKTATYQICSPVINTNTYEYMGTWNNDNRLDLVNNVLFGNDFTDFGNKTLTIATKPVSSFICT